jgi:hypothetical protein
LGDIIDDYCSRCRMLTNHAIISLVNEQPAKVHCRTCFFEHNYQHGQGVEKKKPSARKAKLFNEVLSSITGSPAADGAPSEAPPAESSETPPKRDKAG